MGLKINRYRRRLDAMFADRQKKIALDPDNIIANFSAVSINTSGLIDRFGPAITENTLRLAALQSAYIDVWNALSESRSIHHAECMLAGFVRRKI